MRAVAGVLPLSPLAPVAVTMLSLSSSVVMTRCTRRLVRATSDAAYERAADAFLRTDMRHRRTEIGF
jgi:hypothetical protein